MHYPQWSPARAPRGPEVLMCFTPVSSSGCLPLVVAPQPATFLWAAHNVAGTVSQQVRPPQSWQLLLETPRDGVRCANLSKLNSITHGFESLADWLLVRKERGWNPFILEVSQFLVPLLLEYSCKMLQITGPHDNLKPST